MKILALETSAKAVSAAVSENGRILAAGYQDTGLTHSRTLMPIVEHILKNTDMKLADMDAIAVAVGPGSFTGIRIGVAAAKGLAFSVDKPAVGVSTLAAMARNVAFADGLVVCAMDARRNQVYNANFAAESGVLTRLTPDRAISLADLAEEVRNDPGGRRRSSGLRLFHGAGSSLPPGPAPPHHGKCHVRGFGGGRTGRPGQAGIRPGAGGLLPPPAPGGPPEKETGPH